MTWVKICGTTNLRDAELAVAAGADALGFIFSPSPRAIDLDAAAEIIRGLPAAIETIGVFVNQAPCAVAEVAKQASLSGVQLHGDEPAESLSGFRSALGNRRIIKVLHAGELSTNSRTPDDYLAAGANLDAILLDSGSHQRRGGTGSAYDWNQALPIARKIRETLPLIIAGGLDARNVARAIELFDPWGIDVVSGVEAGPGRKDGTKLRDFIAAARQTAASTPEGK
jgi:phosphoribosylanthranilate isomerase